MPTTGKLSDLKKMMEVSMPAIPTPVECQQVLERLEYYSKQELIDLLDYWDLKQPEFYKKKEFMFELRTRLQEVKHGAEIKENGIVLSDSTASLAPTLTPDMQTLKSNVQLLENNAQQRVKFLEMQIASEKERIENEEAEAKALEREKDLTKQLNELQKPKEETENGDNHTDSSCATERKATKLSTPTSSGSKPGRGRAEKADL